jgi:tetratricopeptide (TPR) repeat protein
MRHIVAVGLATVLLGVATLVAQRPGAEAERATRFYRLGWDAFHREAWPEAAADFQQAIGADPNYALAYYALGRTEMAQRNFGKAIAAYARCRDIYIARGGERFTNQLDRSRQLEDQLLEYRAAVTQAGQTSTVKAGSQSQSLYVMELQNRISRLEQARDRNINISVDLSVPYFVPMALGAAYFRNGQFADAEREYKAAIDANQSSGETHSNLAVLYLTVGRLEEAAREVALAETTGFKVNPQLKKDIDDRRRK